jgi:exopolyphosphatase/guanosine-5'-triphosphate,3'-diphosphate pyrophosphatase
MAKPEAVIEIGSTGIRLLVAEITHDGKRNILDRSDLPVSLGRDVFTVGSISRDSLLQSLSILKRYREQLAGWGITPEETTAVATSALREAKNRDPVCDRIMVKTGFRVKVIDGIEENRLMYLAVTECLKDEAVSVREQDSIILEVGGGSTEMMLIEKGKMAGAHSMRLGTVIIEQQLKVMLGSLDDARRYIEEFIRNTKGSLNNELNLSKVQQFIAIGSDARIAAIYCGKPVSPFLWQINREDFDRFVNELQAYSTEEIIAHFKLSYSDAQSLHISLLAYKLFIKLTNVKTIIVPETSIREGLIISKKAGANTELEQEFYTQITASALNLLRKYNGDEKHAQYVRMISLKLFDALKDELGLEHKARMLLETAALLHDVGMFIRADDHNIHSKYIIEHSEIFGLSKDESTIVAEIAKYHRGTIRPQDNTQFLELPRDGRLTILKLTAILRVADALDRAHTQRISEFKISFTNDTMTMTTNGQHHNVLEKIAVTEKSDMFESVFGYRVILV